MPDPDHSVYPFSKKAHDLPPVDRHPAPWALLAINLMTLTESHVGSRTLPDWGDAAVAAAALHAELLRRHRLGEPLPIDRTPGRHQTRRPEILTWPP